MSYPQVVALDTDWTIWQGYLDPTRWGRGPAAFAKVEDNIERENRSKLRDRTNHTLSISVFNDVSRIVTDILRNGAKLAIVSRNPSKAMCDRALYYFNAINPKDNNEWSIIHLVDYNEVVNEPKPQPFRRIRQWSASDYADMILFDDEASNHDVKSILGVSFQFLRENRGLTWDAYQRGIAAWRRAKNITILSNPATSRKRMHIGYTGLPMRWINAIRRGEGLTPRGDHDHYRWGFALYVAPSSGMARLFRDLERQDRREAHVCRVIVRDYNAWKGINKIWVPENDSRIPWQPTGNFPEAQGRNQENRDRFIANQWKVSTPYVLFSRHHWIQGMSLPKRRFTEMVVYTQICRSLFEIEPLTDAQVNQIGGDIPFNYRHQFNEWRIIVPPATTRDFQSHRETEFHKLSLSAPRP